MRTVKQLIVMAHDRLTALCEDGTIWAREPGSGRFTWVQIPGPPPAREESSKEIRLDEAKPKPSYKKPGPTYMEDREDHY